MIDGAVHKITGRERRITQVTGVALIHHALAHLGGEEGNASHVDQVDQGLGHPFAISAGANHDQRIPGFTDHVTGNVQALGTGSGPTGITGLEDMGIALCHLGGDVFR